MKEIPLTKGMVALVDDEDYESLSRLSWQARSLGRSDGRIIWYAIAKTLGSASTRRGVFMHRVILGLGPGEWGDHRNGNGLDNQKSNLRAVTPRQNSYNTAKIRAKNGTPTKSRFKGVHFRDDKRRKRWVAMVQGASGKRQYLGIFLTENEAAQAYDEAARREFGSLCCVNFPRDDERSAI